VLDQNLLLANLDIHYENASSKKGAIKEVVTD